MLSSVMKKLKDCEYEAYTRIRKTKIKRKMWADYEIFLDITKKLEKQEEDLSKLKVNDKIFKVRGKQLLEERGEEAFAMTDNQGNLIEDKEGVSDVLADYNETLLSREPHPEEFREIFEKRKRKLLIYWKRQK